MVNIIIKIIEQEISFDDDLKKKLEFICESNGIQISMSRKGTPIDDSPIESWHSLLKKETLYNNNITSLQEYIQLVEEWILFYNPTRLKSKVKKKRKNYAKREK